MSKRSTRSEVTQPLHGGVESSSSFSQDSRDRDRPRRLEGGDIFIVVSAFSFLTGVTILVMWLVGLVGDGVWVNTPESHVELLSDASEFSRYLGQPGRGPLLLAFYSEDCGACKRMRAPFLEASAIERSVTFLALKARGNGEFADKFKIQYVPKLLFFAAGSDTPVVYKGGASKASIVQFIKDIQQKKEKPV